MNILIILVILILVLFVLFALAINFFFGYAFLGIPYVPDKRRFAFNTPFEPAYLAGRKALSEAPQDIVSIVSFDGLKLFGHYFETPGAKRTIVMCHGWHGAWNYEFATEYPWFLEQGCNLLIIEMRAQGKSEGMHITFGMKEYRDVESWVNWLREEHRPERVYLYGKSMGCATVLLTAGLCRFSVPLSGVIADCGYVSAYDQILKSGRDWFPVTEHPLMDLLSFLAGRRIGIGLRTPTTLDAVRQMLCPVLFVHGTADTFVPCENSRKNYEACSSDCELLMVEGAEHCLSSSVAPERFYAAVQHLFEKAEET